MLRWRNIWMKARRFRSAARVWGHNVRGTGGTGENEWFTPAEYIAAGARGAWWHRS